MTESFKSKVAALGALLELAKKAETEAVIAKGRFDEAIQDFMSEQFGVKDANGINLVEIIQKTIDKA